MAHQPEAAGAALICIYYPQQLVPAMAALLQYRQGRRLAADAPALVALWCPPGLPPELAGRRIATVQRLLSSFPGVSFRPIQGAQAGCVQSHWSVHGRARALAALLPGVHATEILFAHDLTDDFFAQAAMQAWPGAQRICYGDAWGVVYSNRHFESETFPLAPRALARPGRFLRNLAARCRRTVNRWPARRMLRAQSCLLILPLDPGGDVLHGTTSARVQPGVVRQVIARLAAPLVAGVPRNESGATLLLVGSYAESRLCSVEQELALYASAVARHVPEGVAIVVKPHPAGDEDKTRRLLQLLEELGWRPCRLPAGLDEVPVELLADAWSPAPILSFSYSSVSLTYLGYPRVVHALDSDLIRRHFPLPSVRWLEDSNRLYLGQIEAARVVAAEGAGA